MASKKQKEERKEFGRFSLVGFTATLIDYGILNLLANVFGVPLILSNIVSATTSSYYSYMLNKKVVFKDKAHSERKTVLLYAGTLIISIFIIQSAVLWVLGHGVMESLIAKLGLDGKVLEVVASNASKVVAGLCTVAWNFFTQRKFVFVSNGESRSKASR